MDAPIASATVQDPHMPLLGFHSRASSHGDIRGSMTAADDTRLAPFDAVDGLALLAAVLVAPVGLIACLALRLKMVGRAR